MLNCWKYYSQLQTKLSTKGIIPSACNIYGWQGYSEPSYFRNFMNQFSLAFSKNSVKGELANSRFAKQRTPHSLKESWLEKKTNYKTFLLRLYHSAVYFPDGTLEYPRQSKVRCIVYIFQVLISHETVELNRFPGSLAKRRKHSLSIPLL